MIDARLQTLRVLHAQGTVTAAAAVLHVTPSTVSQQLRQLAADLGVTLLERQGRLVRLTPVAHALVRHADTLFAQWERAAADLATYREGVTGRLRVTSIATALATIAAPALARLRAAHPRLDCELGEDPDTDRYQLLLTGRADIAVVIPGPAAPSTHDARYEQHPLLHEPQDLLVPTGHPLARRPALTLAEAADEKWLVAGDPRDQHQLVLGACATAGFTPRLAHSAVDWTAVAALVAHGFGVSLIPRLAPLPGELDVVRVPLRGPAAPTRRLVMYIRRGSAERSPVAHGLRALKTAATRWQATAGAAR